MVGRIITSYPPLKKRYGEPYLMRNPSLHMLFLPIYSTIASFLVKLKKYEEVPFPTSMTSRAR